MGLSWYVKILCLININSAICCVQKLDKNWDSKFTNMGMNHVSIIIVLITATIWEKQRFGRHAGFQSHCVTPMYNMSINSSCL